MIGDVNLFIDIQDKHTAEIEIMIAGIYSFESNLD